MKVLAFIFLALGIASLVFGGIGFDRQKTVFEVGGLKATATERKSIPIAPILGVLMLIAGTTMLIVDTRRAQGKS